MTFIPKVADTNHYHLWTDALHARALAHQTRDRWDRGSYVRWTVIIAWTALEIACQEAFNDRTISYSFRKNLDAAVAARSLPPLDWGTGVWQRVAMLQAVRKSYVHSFATTTNLFPVAEKADEAIVTARQGICAAFQLVGLPIPAWTADDSDRGWVVPLSVTTHGYAIHAGVDPDGPDTIRLTYVCADGERLTACLPPDTDYQAEVEGLVRRVRIPVSQVNVYRGQTLIYTLPVNMRGI